MSDVFGHYGTGDSRMFGLCFQKALSKELQCILRQFSYVNVRFRVSSTSNTNILWSSLFIIFRMFCPQDEFEETLLLLLISEALVSEF